MTRIAIVALAVAALAPGCGGAGTAAREVVVYTSVDQPFSEPILDAYEARTGVRVRALFDTEATKTVGLANRLLAEQEHPRADVFWNSEVIRTILLARRGVFEPYRSPAAGGVPGRYVDPAGCWTGVAARARVLLVDTRRVPPGGWPRTLDELAEPRWRGKVAISSPFFGTAGAHVAALYAAWGAERARGWLERLAANGVRVVDGNSTARDLVVAGVVPVALVDTDDAAVAVARGDPVAIVYPDADGSGTFVFPNTVALVAGAPHPDEGRALIDYLVSREVERRLVTGECAEIPLRDRVAWPRPLPPRGALRAMPVEYDDVADHLEEALADCQRLFAR